MWHRSHLQRQSSPPVLDDVPTAAFGPLLFKAVETPGARWPTRKR